MPAPIARPPASWTSTLLLKTVIMLPTALPVCTDGRRHHAIMMVASAYHHQNGRQRRERGTIDVRHQDGSAARDLRGDAQDLARGRRHPEHRARLAVRSLRPDPG